MTNVERGCIGNCCIGLNLRVGGMTGERCNFFHLVCMRGHLSRYFAVNRWDVIVTGIQKYTGCGSGWRVILLSVYDSKTSHAAFIVVRIILLRGEHTSYELQGVLRWSIIVMNVILLFYCVQ